MLLTLAHGAVWAVRDRVSAATRHLVWTAALSLIAVLPALEIGLPRWEPGPVVHVPSAAAVQSAPPAEVAEAFEVSGESAVTEAVILPLATERAVPVPEPVRDAQHLEASSIGVVDGLRALPWFALLLGTWMVGVLLFGFYRGLALIARQVRFRRRASAVGCADWTEDLTWARRRTGVRRPVRLLESATVPVPATWGALRPVIVLPRSARDWPRTQRRATLLHELFHVRRADHLIQTLGWLVVGLHWFNPLIWSAHRRLRADAEHACDDAVLRAGQRPSEYASGLLSVARSLRSSRRSLQYGVAMARSPEVSRRLEAVLDSGRPRNGASRTAMLATLAAVAFLAVPLAALGPRYASTFELEEPTADVEHSELAALTGLHAATNHSGRQEATLSGRQEVVCLPEDGEGVSSVVQDRNRKLEAEWDLGHCVVQVELRGSVEFTEDESAVARIADDGSLVLRQRGPTVNRKLLVTGDQNGHPEYRYEVDGSVRPMDQGGSSWLAALIPQIYRVTGWQADARVERILRDGGPGAVMDEVRHIASDHVAALYLRHLMAATDLSDAEVEEAFQVAGERIQSDYELARLLMESWRPDLSEAARREYLTAAATLESDYELGRVMTAFLEDASSGPDVAAVLELAPEIASDHELSQVLHVVLDRARSESVVQEAVLMAMAEIQSDYERTQLLMEVGRRFGADALASDLYLEVAEGIGSDYELARALKELLGGASLDGGHLNRVIDLSERIDSDYERARLLAMLIDEHAPLPAAVHDRVIDAAESFDSEHEQNRVLARLVRSSR